VRACVCMGCVCMCGLVLVSVSCYIGLLYWRINVLISFGRYIVASLGHEMSRITLRGDDVMR